MINHLTNLLGEGLQAWGKENGLTKDHGFTYFQSTNESEYATNLEQAASSNYKLVFGIGFALRNAAESAFAKGSL